MSLCSNSEETGCFVVNGHIKTLVSQEKLCVNRAFVFQGKKNSKYSHICQIRSKHGRKLRSTSTLEIKLISKTRHLQPVVVVNIPFLNVDIPLCGVFCVLGIEDRERMIDMLCDNCRWKVSTKHNAKMKNLMRSIVEFGPDIPLNRNSWLEWIGKNSTNERSKEKRLKHVTMSFKNEFLPHMDHCWDFIGNLMNNSIRPETHFAKKIFINLTEDEQFLFNNVSKNKNHVETIVETKIQEILKWETLSFKKRTSLLGRDFARVAATFFSRGGRLDTINLKNDLFQIVEIMKRQTQKKSSKKNTTKTGECDNEEDDDELNDDYSPSSLHNSNILNYVTSTMKVRFFAKAVQKLLMVDMGFAPCDDVDDYKNKRVSPAGTLCAHQLRQCYNNGKTTIRSHLYKMSNQGKKNGLTDVFNHRLITSHIKCAFATGNWGTLRGSSNQTGVSQILNETNTMSRVAHLRTLNTPINRDGKQAKPRQLDVSSYGLICPSDTPEGKSVGLLNMMCLLVSVRVGTSTDSLSSFLHWKLNLSLKDDVKAQPYSQLTKTLVTLNGCSIGETLTPEYIVTQLLDMRQNLEIPMHTEIFHNKKNRMIFIQMDSGSLSRPLLTKKGVSQLVKKVKKEGIIPCTLLDNMFNEGLIQYIDKEEESTKTVALGIRWYSENSSLYTHSDLNPNLCVGPVIGCTPHAEHNQSPRNVYQSGKAKQSQSVLGYRKLSKYPTKEYILEHAQKPMVATSTLQHIRGHDDTCGHNVVIAVAACDGFNQEDAIVINQASVDRGLFQSSFLKSIRVNEKSFGSDVEKIGMIDVKKTEGIRNVNYSKLGKNGYVPVGGMISAGDVIIGKTFNYSKSKRTLDGTIKNYKIAKDCSETYTHNKDAIVHRVNVLDPKMSPNGKKTVILQTIAFDPPEVGDKLSSRHGQKGIIGRIVPCEDMPFDSNGVAPDVIVTPHGQVGRMTVGQYYESLTGLIASKLGIVFDGTSWKDIDKRTLIKDIIGKDKVRMQSGLTGEMFHASIFTGIAYFQPLRHKVSDKIHARSTGRRQMRTRQPLEGRVNHGGLRLGEMERDAMVGNGLSECLDNLLIENSDAFYVYICTTCCRYCEPPPDKKNMLRKMRGNKPFCRSCGSTNALKVRKGYATKTLVQELEALHVVTKFQVE
jgi:DNA-directed RNA polymerase II subunit RPB2